MSHARWTRRAGAVLVCAALLAVTSGCRRSPFQRLTDGPPPVADATNGAAWTSQVLPASRVAPEPPSPTPTAVAASASGTFPLAPIPPGPDAAPPGGALMPAGSTTPALQSWPLPDRANGSVAAASPPRRDAALRRASLDVAPPSPHAEGGSSQPIAAAVVHGAVPSPRPDPKPATRPIGVARRTELVASPADLAALKKACAQAAGWLSFVRAKAADPFPLMVAAAALASIVEPPLRSETGPDAGRSPTIADESGGAGPAITGLRLCRKVNGLGDIEPMDATRLGLGQPALLYCERAGLGHEEKPGVYVSRLSSRVELVSAADGKTVWELSLGEARDESKIRRDHCYVNYRLSFPRAIPPGAYRLRLIQTDLGAGRTVSSEIPVTFLR